MEFKIITIPFNEGKEIFYEEDFKKFCLNKKIHNYRIEFFQLGSKAYWTVFLEYETVMDKKKNEEQFTEAERLFRKKLKEWRYMKAEESGVPVYIIFTNAQLDDVTKQKPDTLESLKRIRGFGEKKLKTFGKDIISMSKEFFGNHHE